MKKKWFFKLMGLFILINIILVTYNFLVLKQKRNEYQKLIQEQQLSERRQFNQNISYDFYDSPCPDIILNSISGEKIELRNLAGNVILIRFSRFYRQDLSNLVYLQHLADKYENQGLSLIFINSLGIHDKEEIDKIVSLVSPIIEDDGSIAAQFNAFSEDFIIIDRGFNIKFKHPLVSKPLLYKEAIKWIFKDLPQPTLLLSSDLTRSVQEITFYDVLEKSRKEVSEFSKRKICLTLFTSTCTGCEENKRIKYLKELSMNLDSNGSKILMLFGKGNNPEQIESYAKLNDWNNYPIIVGVIEDSYSSSKEGYYQIFQLDTDPRTIILDSNGKIIFAETERTSKLIDYEFLKKQIL